MKITGLIMRVNILAIFSAFKKKKTSFGVTTLTFKLNSAFVLYSFFLLIINHSIILFKVNNISFHDPFSPFHSRKSTIK